MRPKMPDGRNKGVCPNIRWAIARDLPDIHKIDGASNYPTGDEDAIFALLKKRNVVGMVAEMQRDGPIMGFMIYELQKTQLYLLTMAVHPHYLELGVGTALIDRLKTKLHPDRRTKITLDVRETDLDTQLFLRSQDFKAVKVRRHYYEDTEEDAFLMEYRVSEVHPEDIPSFRRAA